MLGRIKKEIGPIDWEDKECMEKIASWVDAQGEVTDLRDGFQRTILIIAAENNATTLIEKYGGNTKLRDLTDEEGNTALVSALLHGSIHGAWMLLAMGSDLTIKNNAGQCAEDLIKKMNNSVMKLSFAGIKQGAGVLSITSTKEMYNPSTGSNSDKIAFARYALKHEFDQLDLEDKDQAKMLGNILFTAGQYEVLEEMLTYFLEAGVDFMMQYTDRSLRDLVLEYASTKECIGILKEAGVDLESPGYLGMTPAAIIAAKDCQVQEAKEMAPVFEWFSKESMEAFDRKGNSAIHYAAARLKEEILLVMQKKGANINLKKLDTTHDYPPLYTPGDVASMVLNRGEIKEKEGFVHLLKAMPDLEMGEIHGISRIHLIMLLEPGLCHDSDKDGDYKIYDVRLGLLDMCKDVNLRNNYQQTPIMYERKMDEYRTPRIVKYFIDRGADVNAKDINGNSVLSFFLHTYKSMEAVKYLVEAGADVNARNKEGDTLLHIAVKEYDGINLSAEILLKAGARYDIEDRNGDTALDLAKRGTKDYFHRLIDLMSDNLISLLQQKAGFTIDWEKEEDCDRLADLLLSDMRLLFTKNADGGSILMLASRLNSTQLIYRILKEHDELKYEKDKNGKTAFDYAMDAQAISAAECLVLGGGNFSDTHSTSLYGRGDLFSHRAVGFIGDTCKWIQKHFKEPGMNFGIAKMILMHIVRNPEYTYADLAYVLNAFFIVGYTKRAMETLDELEFDFDASLSTYSLLTYTPDSRKGYLECVENMWDLLVTRTNPVELFRYMQERGVNIHDANGRDYTYANMVGLCADRRLSDYVKTEYSKDRDRDIEKYYDSLLAFFDKEELEENNTNGYNVLHLAAEKGNMELVRALGRKGVDLDIHDDSADCRSYQHETALAIACREHNWNVVSALLSMGAKDDEADSAGNYPMHHFASKYFKDYLPIVGQFIHLNVKNNQGQTPLMLIAENDMDHVVVKHMVSLGADVNATDHKGNTLLHYMVKKYLASVDSVREVLSIPGVDINAQNDEGETPLVLLLKSNRNEYARDMAACLIAAGADVEKTDNRRNNAMSLLSEKGFTELLSRVNL